MGFDVRSSCSRAEAAEFVFDEKFADQGFAEAESKKSVILSSKLLMWIYSLANALRPTSLGKRDLIPKNIRKRGIAILAFERCRSKQHFVYENPESPPIHGARVSATLNHFWRNVLFGPDE